MSPTSWTPSPTAWARERLYRATPAQSDVPERSVRRIEPTAAPTGETWPAHWPRPTRLLPHPERIETLALLPDQPPTAFTWRGVRRRVKRADGPERIFGEWWRRDGEIDAVRDYFQLEDEAGERFWVFSPRRRRTGRHRRPDLVPARAVRMNSRAPSRALRRAAGDLALLVPARRLVLRGPVQPGRPHAGSRPWPSSTATRSPASFAPTRRPRSPESA